ncbi:MAG: hypothetical protein NWQ23_03940 [Yoonia sp.]|uniref:hypothetical protein n=1 Tax=Yoonia sp. TaxID=2212373 RepID=UPI00273E0DBB|nr:hypothetical protein [Yoonia sp.]MDP5084549.1 hypothetical protein [Yoonia sp.]MDP5362601.1 hypothetical protein [Paracoccaceae bacterium]
MNHRILPVFVLLFFAGLATTATSENHVEPSDGSSGVRYGNDDCNNSPSYLAANDISCTAIFSDINVWDFLNNLPRRISLETLIELNPSLGTVDYNTVLKGMMFVRVR